MGFNATWNCMGSSIVLYVTCVLSVLRGILVACCTGGTGRVPSECTRDVIVGVLVVVAVCFKRDDKKLSSDDCTDFSPLFAFTSLFPSGCPLFSGGPLEAFDSAGFLGAAMAGGTKGVCSCAVEVSICGALELLRSCC